ncbi:MAG TPA: hypothetical protein PKG81_04840, partial [Candidatus Omnitrophota bacterium]|nr:hypothetical protein [Candidatus Omnitrophota bacterium]
MILPEILSGAPNKKGSRMRAFFICPAGRVATEDVMSEGVPGSPRPGPTDLFIMQCGYFYCGAIFRFAQNVPNSNEIKH